MNFDKQLNKILKSNKTNLSSGSHVFKYPRVKGAPPSVQEKWKKFSPNNKRILRKKNIDSDGDGVPNKWDCQSRNPFRQDSLNLEEFRAKQKEYREKPEVIAKRKAYLQRPEVIARKKGYHKSPEARAKQMEYRQRPEVIAKRIKYLQTPEYKARVKELRQKPEARAKAKAYEQRPEARAKQKEYREKPEAKARQREYSQRPEAIEKRREYTQRPEVKEKKKEHDRLYNLKPEVIAAHRAYARRPEVLQYLDRVAPLHKQEEYKPPKYLLEEFYENPEDSSRLPKGRCHDAASCIITDAKNKGIPDSELSVTSVRVIGSTKTPGLSKSHVVAKVRDKYYDPTKIQFGFKGNIVSKELHEKYREEEINKPSTFVSQDVLKKEKDKIEGAPLQKQEEWEDKPQQEKIKTRIIKPDTDRDNVPDEYDCQPNNPNRQEDPVGKAKLKCNFCGEIYSSYIVSSGDWNKLPIEHRKKEVCQKCYKKITGHNPTILLAMGGASLQKQQEWKKFDLTAKTLMRRKFMDSDRDGVPNIWDCRPKNPLMQDTKPNRLVRERIDKLPIYYVEKGKYGKSYDWKDEKGKVRRHTADIYDAAYDVEKLKKQGDVQHISDKDFPEAKRREVYGMIKKHPHLMSSIEQSNKINILYGEKPKDGIVAGFNAPMTNEENILSGSTVVSFDEDKRTNLSKDTDAEILFHELEHNRQNEGLTHEEYAKGKANASIDLKSYFNNPSEVGAREEQFSKLGERLGDKGEQAFRNIEESKQKSHIEQIDSGRPKEDFTKERTEARQEEYDKYREEEAKDKVDTDINEDVTSGLKSLEE